MPTLGVTDIFRFPTLGRPRGPHRRRRCAEDLARTGGRTGPGHVGPDGAASSDARRTTGGLTRAARGCGPATACPPAAAGRPRVSPPHRDFAADSARSAPPRRRRAASPDGQIVRIEPCAPAQRHDRGITPCEVTGLQPRTAGRRRAIASSRRSISSALDAQRARRPALAERSRSGETVRRGGRVCSSPPRIDYTRWNEQIVTRCPGRSASAEISAAAARRACTRHQRLQPGSAGTAERIRRRPGPRAGIELRPRARARCRSSPGMLDRMMCRSPSRHRGRRRPHRARSSKSNPATRFMPVAVREARGVGRGLRDCDRMASRPRRDHGSARGWRASLRPDESVLVGHGECIACTAEDLAAPGSASTSGIDYGGTPSRRGAAYRRRRWRGQDRYEECRSHGTASRIVVAARRSAHRARPGGARPRHRAVAAARNLEASGTTRTRSSRATSRARVIRCSPRATSALRPRGVRRSVRTRSPHDARAAAARPERARRRARAAHPLHRHLRGLRPLPRRPLEASPRPRARRDQRRPLGAAGSTPVASGPRLHARRPTFSIVHSRAGRAGADHASRSRACGTGSARPTTARSLRCITYVGAPSSGRRATKQRRPRLRRPVGHDGRGRRHGSAAHRASPRQPRKYGGSSASKPPGHPPVGCGIPGASSISWSSGRSSIAA